ncbi:FkbM family methyltransferase [Nocardioides montaniterrae]
MSSLVGSVRRRAGWFVRDRFPRRAVVREVQGVEMVLPWSHRLPDYTGNGSIYGQNLVELAKLLAETSELTVLDVGANVGDSTLQILDAADGRVLCVEADKFYLDFLHRNVDADPRVTVVESLLAVDDAAAKTTAVRSGGTTRFVEATGAEDAMPSITPTRLRETQPDFADMRLVKSDTDGYDCTLIPVIAEAWAESKPVLFFEYDPYLTRIAGYDPVEVWTRLDALGYHRAAVWMHHGGVVGQLTGEEIAARHTELDDFNHKRPGSRSYWDIAVVHDDDAAGLAVLDRLMPRR